MWNDGKRHVLKFKSIRRTIEFKGALLLKIGSNDFEGLLKSHSGPKENTLPAASLDQVLNGILEDQQGRWTQGEISLGTEPTSGVVTLILIPKTRPLTPIQAWLIFSSAKRRIHV